VIIVRLAVCAVMLAVSSYFDIKTREVEDWFWVVFGAVGVALTGYEFFTSSPNLLLYLFSFILTSGLAYLLYVLGFYGGADAKALSAISLLVPFFNLNSIIHPITGLIILTNSTILTLIFPVYFGLRNLVKVVSGEKIFEGFESEPLLKKILASLLGYRIKVSAKGRFLMRLERTVDGKRKLDISMRGVDEDFVEESDVWVTPGLPLLLFMAIGFVVMVLFGDILALLIRAIFRVG
jgi:preflagellin peptidase FlaK